MGCFSVQQCSFPEEGKPYVSIQQDQYLTNEAELIGRWEQSSTIWDSENLYLYSDHTFSYRSESCLGVVESAGYWNLSLEKIQLTSFERYEKADTAVKPVYTYKHIANKKHHGKIQDNDSLTFHLLDMSNIEATLVNSQMLETGKLFFRQVMFQKVGNSLVYAGNLPKLQGIKLEKDISAANTSLPKAISH
jgi:hypothetical protein